MNEHKTGVVLIYSTETETLYFLFSSTGYNRMGDAYSDSGHSEISSRSSLVSNSSFDMAQEERRLRHSGGVGDSHIVGARLERRATTDPDQYSLG